MIDLRLINFDYGLDENTSNLVPYSDKYPEHLLNNEATCMLHELLEYIDGEDLIFPISAYRSSIYQKKIFDDSVIEHGLEYTKTFVALPGHSEHQSGLAIDLSTDKEESDIIAPKFSYEGIGQDFLNHMQDFGFILRYPKDKEEITKIGYEPWHFRFVGLPHSKIMKKMNLCLEEYLEYLKSYSLNKPLIYDDYKIFYNSKPLDIKGYTMSPNNYDGYIYTGKYGKTH